MNKQKRLESNLRVLRREQDRCQQQSQRITWWRVAVFFAGLFLTGLGLEFGGWIGALVAFVLSLSLFTYLVKEHRKIKSHLYRLKLWQSFKQNDLARLHRDWQKLPLHPTEAPKGHPFALDIDVIGRGSLLHLMDTTFSENGYQRLKSWLLETEPHLETTFQRQATVKELLPLVRFRQGVTLCLKESAQHFRHVVAPEDKWKSQEILDFIAGFEVQPQFHKLLGALSVLCACNWLFFISEKLLGTPALLWQISLTLYVILFLQNKDQISKLFQESFQLSFHLYRLKDLFAFLKGVPCEKRPHLQGLLMPFQSGEGQPEQKLKALQRIVSAGSVQGNPMAWVVVNLLLPWDFIFAHQLNKLKPELKELMPKWLDKIYELEALNALAHFAWLNPEFHYPLLAKDNLPMIVQDMGHPLLAKKVRNTFSLKRLEEAFIITGSNMAGKSTFLKSLGLNLILAQAGTVVDAGHFAAQPMRIFTCIKVSDSVQDGLSYFYAEVTRLKALLDALEQEHDLPLFFLIDEIFKGTNNKERLIGSQAYIQALTHKHGVGGISTHDLELVNLARENPRLSNFHFREDIVEGKMSFDYTIRPGPCPTTNALKIMELEGLPVALTPKEEGPAAESVETGDLGAPCPNEEQIGDESVEPLSDALASNPEAPPSIPSTESKA